MASTAVNLRKLNRLLDEFHMLTDIRISFWDAEGKCVAANSGGNSAFCSRIRECASLDAECARCDMQGIRDAFEHAGLHVFTCHAGFHEYVYPVMEGGRLIGYFMIGQVNMPETYGDIISEQRDMYRLHGLDEEELRSLFEKLPVMTHEKMLAAGHMLEALAGYIYMKGLVRTYEPPLCERLKVYIQENLKSTLTLDEIAVQLNVSRSTLCHTVRREMNESVTTVIRRMRAEKAVELLRSGMRLNAAAQAAGFSSAGYCARVIRQVLGISHSELLKGENSDEGSGCESTMEI